MISRAALEHDIRRLLYPDPLDIDDEDLEACAVAIYSFELAIRPLSPFEDLDDEDKEDYRKLAMAVINTLRERL